MRLLQPAVQLSLLAAIAPSVYAASSWGFSDATVSVQSKTAKGTAKESLKEHAPLPQAISLGASDTLKLLLTTQEGRSAKRPHQAFLLLKDPTTGLDISYPFNVKDNGKSKVEVTQKDLPIQFLSNSHPVDADIVIGSFGLSQSYHSLAFHLSVDRDQNAPVSSPPAERYGKQPEIHHIFKADAQSPPPVITLAFLLMVLCTIPALAASWLSLGANMNHLPVALKSAPLPHVIFLGSILGLEGIFFLYYTSWTLFQTLPAALVVGTIAYLSGSRALSEVLERRLAGLR